jgi:hypothetical protein
MKSTQKIEDFFQIEFTTHRNSSHSSAKYHQTNHAENSSPHVYNIHVLSYSLLKNSSRRWRIASLTWLRTKLPKALKNSSPMMFKSYSTLWPTQVRRRTEPTSSREWSHLPYCRSDPRMEASYSVQVVLIVWYLQDDRGLHIHWLWTINTNNILGKGRSCLIPAFMKWIIN